ncbi:MAG: ABC transporter ATP-binding protein [Nisaea sp.]|uniref:ABC transporter ATP-binding protein n=1 Tax=Nisaea sp. TaxID=2024842 RepID=UPI003298311F
MAKITLDDLRHAYAPDPERPEDYALQQLDVTFENGGAYALLGPSGCGKTTLLNIISGLLTPSHGKVLFDGKDVTELAPDERHIAQVFQFPVVYDNLAFPLRNRGVTEADVDKKVREIAAMIDLEDTLMNRASGLTADGKQKISLGRGLVRSDVNVIMFDEPLTVIDPHLKWQLRSKLKELHQRVNRTMIYVTHDQTEALTFADKVVVMNVGQVVQIGTPVELFETPGHEFVGHFIGSPGMNILDCEVKGGQAFLHGQPVQTSNAAAVKDGAEGSLRLGIRPEFVTLSEKDGIAADVVKVSDSGRYQIVETRVGDVPVKLLVNEGIEIPTGRTALSFRADRTRVYRDGWLVA